MEITLLLIKAIKESYKKEVISEPDRTISLAEEGTKKMEIKLNKFSMPEMQCIHGVMVSNSHRKLLGREFGMSSEAFRVY